jgi:hypothetical protein
MMSTYEQVKGQVPEVVKSLVKRAGRDEGRHRVVRCRTPMPGCGRLMLA